MKVVVDRMSFMPSVRDLMTKDNTTIYLNETVFDAARLMSEKLVGCLVVMDGEMPVGIVTERDFVRNARAQKTRVISPSVAGSSPFYL